MSTKKTLMIIGGSVLGLFLLAFLTIVIIGFVNRATNGTRVDNNSITSAYFEVTVPEGSELTNSDETSNNIYVTTPTAYGELRTSINRSSANVIKLNDRGKVTESTTTVDGTSVTLKTVDYSNIIAGASEKLLIRYRVGIDKIPQPSDKEYSSIEVTAMSKRNLTSAEKKDVEEKAKAIIESLVIK